MTLTRWLAAVAAVTLLALLVWVIVNRWPRSYQIKITEPVRLASVREEVIAITLDPSGGTITVPQQNGVPIKGTIQLDSQVGHVRLTESNPETIEVEHTETVQPATMDNLRIWVLAGAAVLAGIAILGALLIWLNEHRNGKKAPAEVNKFLYASILFVGGLLTGNFGHPDTSHGEKIREAERATKTKPASTAVPLPTTGG